MHQANIFRHFNTAQQESLFTFRHLKFTSVLSPMEKFEPLSGNPGFQMRSSKDSVVLMTEMSAFEKLVSLNPSKAHGSDEIPGWLLKENADLLTIPIL